MSHSTHHNPELGHEPRLDPPPDPRDSPDTPADQQPDIVATPAGDNEFAPDQPLEPVPAQAISKTKTSRTNPLRRAG